MIVSKIFGGACVPLDKNRSSVVLTLSVSDDLYLTDLSRVTAPTTFTNSRGAEQWESSEVETSQIARARSK